ncbi:RES family NAD+ phosphorylase [Pantoea ananatis]
MDKKKLKLKKTKFPKPHANISIQTKIIKAGMLLFRIHYTRYGGVQFNNSISGDARFSPIVDRRTKNIIPTIYAGDCKEVAICEVIFHDVDFTKDKIMYEQKNLEDKSHTEIILNGNLQIAVIDQLSVIKMRAGKQLIHCDSAEYDITRSWAEFIHEQYVDIQGLEWPSRQYDGKAYVLFGDRIPSTALVVRKTSPLRKDKIILEKILKIAGVMDITIE